MALELKLEPLRTHTHAHTTHEGDTQTTNDKDKQAHEGHITIKHKHKTRIRRNEHVRATLECYTGVRPPHPRTRVADVFRHSRCSGMVRRLNRPCSEAHENLLHESIPTNCCLEELLSNIDVSGLGSPTRMNTKPTARSGTKNVRRRVEVCRAPNTSKQH